MKEGDKLVAAGKITSQDKAAMSKRVSTMSYSLQGNARSNTWALDFGVTWYLNSRGAPPASSVYHSWDEPLPQQSYLWLQQGHAAVPGGAGQVLWDGKGIFIDLSLTLLPTILISHMTRLRLSYVWFFVDRLLRNWEMLTVSLWQCENICITSPTTEEETNQLQLFLCSCSRLNSSASI